MFLSPRRPEVTVLSTNQRRGGVARISRDPFRRLVSFAVPQRRSPENEARTGTAKSGSRPRLAVETRPRSAPLRSDMFRTLQWKRGIRPHLTSLPEVHGAMFFLTTGMLAAFPAIFFGRETLAAFPTIFLFFPQSNFGFLNWPSVVKTLRTPALEQPPCPSGILKYKLG